MITRRELLEWLDGTTGWRQISKASPTSWAGCGSYTISAKAESHCNGHDCGIGTGANLDLAYPMTQSSANATAAKYRRWLAEWEDKQTATAPAPGESA